MPDHPYGAKGDQFDVFWTGGSAESTIYFETFAGEQPCELEYFNFRGTMRFNLTE